MSAPDFDQFLRVEEQALAAQLQAARAAIDHSGEKGRGLEHEATAFLRRFLPAEYGLATGFIACSSGVVHDGKAQVALSPQIDVIIYDAIRGSPLMDLGAYQVLPLESVYGVVEVKATLYESLPNLYDHSAKVRALKKRHYLLDVEREVNLRPEYDNKVEAMASPDGPEAIREKMRRDFVKGKVKPPRSATKEWNALRYLGLAFEYSTSKTFTAEAARKRAEACFANPGHLHAVLVPETCVLWNELANKDKSKLGKVRVSTESPLGSFRTRVLSALSSFPRPPDGTSVDMRAYFGPAADT